VGELCVPGKYSTIQAAVDAASCGDTVLIALGTTYSETVIVLRKSDLMLQGDVGLEVSNEEPCWDTVSHAVLPVVLVGSVYVVSSHRVSVERLTITGSGPAVWIYGTREIPATSVVVRFCNLLGNQGGAVETAGYYHQLAVTCSNVGMNERGSPILGGAERPEQTDALVICTLRFFEPGDTSEVDPYSNDVVVAVIDSGIDNTLPALSCRMWRNPHEVPNNDIDDDGNGYTDDLYGWDFRDDDPDSLTGGPMHWHGTFVAGRDVLADSFEAYCPPSPSCQLWIMDLRFLDSESTFCTSDWTKLVNAVNYAVDNGARVINFSIYATQEPPLFVRRVFQRAAEHGVVVVAIAGNDASELGPIARWEEVITVGAVDASLKPASFSNIGLQVDLSAPGVDVFSYLPGGELTRYSGTSFAAPCDAGLAAFHLSQNPDLTPEEVEALLKASAVDVGPPGKDPQTGWGAVQ